jgi:hypothetical protein
MGVIADGKAKPESFKHFHIEHFAKYSREFTELLDSLFGSTWVEKSPANQDPFRRLYVHGWPFALKAIASAYHQSRIDELGPLCRCPWSAARRQQDIRRGISGRTCDQAD